MTSLAPSGVLLRPHASSSSGRGQGGSLWLALRGACLVGCAAHLAFLAIFVWLGLPRLTALNLGSLAAFGAAWWLLGRRRNTAANALLAIEIVVHAGIAVQQLGWSSGFQYYLLALVMPLAVGGPSTLAPRLLGIAAVGVYFEALGLLQRLHGPAVTLDPLALDGLRWFNIAGTLTIMTTVAAHYAALLRRSEAAMRALASTDPLTGLNNRRELLGIARRARPTAGAPPRPRCVLLCDIDHFKTVNDVHGHDAGDRALQFVAARLADGLRPGDTLARWGGEEFIVLTDGTELDGAAEIAERLRATIAGTPVPLSATGLLRITITIGVTQVDGSEPIEAAIARADAALYRGKAAGRNRVQIGPGQPDRQTRAPA